MDNKWQKWDETKPESGMKIVIVTDDGCSCAIAFMSDYGLLDGEDAFTITDNYTKGSIWTELPGDYPIAFMERHDDY